MEKEFTVDDYLETICELFEIGYRDAEMLVKFIKFAQEHDIEWKEFLHETETNLTLDKVYGDVIYSICWCTLTHLIDEYAPELRDELYDIASELIYINYCDVYCPVVSDVIDGIDLQEAWKNFLDEALRRKPAHISESIYNKLIQTIKQRDVVL